MTWQTKDAEIVTDDKPVTFKDIKYFELFEFESCKLALKVSVDQAIVLASKNPMRVQSTEIVYPSRYKGM